MIYLDGYNNRGAPIDIDIRIGEELNLGNFVRMQPHWKKIHVPPSPVNVAAPALGGPLSRFHYRRFVNCKDFFGTKDILDNPDFSILTANGSRAARKLFFTLYIADPVSPSLPVSVEVDLCFVFYTIFFQPKLTYNDFTPDPDNPDWDDVEQPDNPENEAVEPPP